MSIQANINQTLSIAGFLFQQGPGKKWEENRIARQNLQTAEEGFNLAATDYKTKIDEYNKLKATKGTRAEPVELKAKETEIERSGVGPAYTAARDRAIGAAEQVYALNPTPENLANIQKFAGSVPAKEKEQFEKDVAKAEENRQKKNERARNARAAQKAAEALSEERRRIILQGTYTGPHNVREVMKYGE